MLPLGDMDALPRETVVLARAIRNGHEHDGSDCDLAVDQDAARYVARIHEYGYVIADADMLRKNFQAFMRVQGALREVRKAIEDEMDACAKQDLPEPCTTCREVYAPMLGIIDHGLGAQGA